MNPKNNPSDSSLTALKQLKETVARLRAPGGCPWDQEQTHQSLCSCLVEECSELLQTIDEGDREHMREELGDLLLQVVMHAQLAEEDGHFDLAAVAKEVNEKLIRRHPHVFSPEARSLQMQDSQAVLERWEAIKAKEKQNKPNASDKAPLFKELPPRLPALLFAFSAVKQMIKKDLPCPWSLEQSFLRKHGEQLTEAEAGEALFQLVTSCYLAKIDPEAALRRYTQQAMNESEQAYECHSD